MGRWTREELEAAFDLYVDATRKAVATGDWAHWAEMYTVDAYYHEHHFGRLWGRDAIRKFMQGCWSAYPAMHMTGFPPVWHVVDTDRGWIVGEFSNRMRDLGDGKFYAAPNISVLRYAGNNQFCHQEDFYNPAEMGEMINSWEKARAELEKAGADNEEAELARHAASFNSQKTF
jgi:hypothetical protein